MADESEVEQALVDLIAADLYPDGGEGVCAADHHAKIYAGWPVSQTLERDLTDGLVHVSVYAVPGATADPGQPFIDTAATLRAPVIGLGVAIAGRTVTFSGYPSEGEYATAIVGQAGYSYLTVAGDGPAQVAAGLAAQIAPDTPGTTASGSTLTFPDPGPNFVIRSGAPAVVGERIHRQRQQFRVVVWAASHQARSAIAKRVDLCLERNLKLNLPDQTQALVVSQGSMPSDLHQLSGVFRRDLMLLVTFDTLDTYLAYEVTHVEIADSPDIFR